jgi:hypothetical protein
MPYRHAHWYILGLIPLIALAFWPSYWSVLSSATWQFHAHGITAFAWLLLLAAQSWTIQHGDRATHRLAGMGSLLLFPLFLVGGAALFFGMAVKMNGGSEFHVLYASRLAWLDIASVAMMVWFYHEALKHRRKVRLHSAYMLATTIALLPPILGRLSGIPLGVTGPGTFDRLYPGFIAGQAIAAAIALVVARGRGPEARPWLWAALFSLIGGLAFATVGGSAAWRGIYAALADVPVVPIMAAAAAAGALVAWSGWNAGKREVPSGALPA